MIIKYGDNIIDYDVDNPYLKFDGSPPWPNKTVNGIKLFKGLSINEILDMFEFKDWESSGIRPRLKGYFKYEFKRLDGKPFDKTKLKFRYSNLDYPNGPGFGWLIDSRVPASGVGEYTDSFGSTFYQNIEYFITGDVRPDYFDGEHSFRMWDLMITIESEVGVDRPYVPPLAWQEIPPPQPLNPGRQKSYPILYKDRETDFTHNGIGIMSDTINAYVTEGRNAGFDFELTYPIDGLYSKELVNGKIIRMIPNTRYDYHNFIITNVEKDVSGYLRVTGSSQNIVELGDNLINRIAGKFSPGNAMRQINTNSIDNMNYTFSSDMTDLKEVLWERRNPLNALVGEEGSAVDLWGGEIFRGDKTVILYKNRGRNTGMQIRPGVNLKGFRMNTDTKPLVTRILPYATIQVEGADEPVVIVGNIVNSQHRNKYSRQPIIPVDFSNEEIKNKLDLDNIARSYFVSGNPGIDIPKVTISADLVALQDTSEFNKYKLLEDIALCDTVNVYIKKYDIDVDIKVVEVKYDVINGRNASVVLGDKSLSPISALAKETYSAIANSTTKLEQIIMTNPNGQKIIYGGPRPNKTQYKSGDIWYEKVNETDWNMWIHNGLDWELIIGDSVIREINESITAVEKEATDAQKSADEAIASTKNLDTRLKGAETDIVSINTEQGKINTKITGLRTDLDNIDLSTRNLALGTRMPKVVVGNPNTAGSDDWTTDTTYRYSNGNNFREFCLYYGVTPDTDLTVTARLSIKNSAGTLTVANFHSNFMYSMFRFTGTGSSWRQFGDLRRAALKDGQTEYYITGTMKPTQGDINVVGGTPVIRSWLRRLPDGYTITVSEYILTIGDREVQYSLAPEDVVDSKTFSEYQQTINGFQTTVQDGFKNIGSDNLLLETSKLTGPITQWKGWTDEGSAGYTLALDKSGYYKQGLENVIAFSNKKTGFGVASLYSTNVQVQRDSMYTLQFKMYGQDNVDQVAVFLVTTPKDSTQRTYTRIAPVGFKPATNKMETYTFTAKVPWDANVCSVEFQLYRKSISRTFIFLIEPILVQGTSVAGYAPGSAFTQTQITQLSDTIVMTNKQVDALGKTQQTQYTQLSDKINLRVEKGDVRSQINLEANRLLFDVAGNIINITPETTYIANATIKDAMIQSIKADKITAGTINAQNVNIVNLNASNITTGTLSAIFIKGPNMTIDLINGNMYSEEIRGVVTKYTYQTTLIDNGVITLTKAEMSGDAGYKTVYAADTGIVTSNLTNNYKLSAVLFSSIQSAGQYLSGDARLVAYDLNKEVARILASGANYIELKVVDGWVNIWGKGLKVNGTVIAT